MTDIYTLEVDGQQFVVEVTDEGPNRFRVTLNGHTLSVRLLPTDAAAPMVEEQASPEDEADVGEQSPGARTVTEVRAPIPGTIVSVEVAAGQSVKYGDTLLVLEAMKMKNLIRSPRAGRVARVHVRPGQSVMHNDVLITFED